jgi:uncharacterized protein (DUF983 family)
VLHINFQPARQVNSVVTRIQLSERVTTLIACPDCRHRLTLPDTFLGKRVQCPKCGFEFDVPEAPAMEVETPVVAPQPNTSTGPSAENPPGAYVPFNGPIVKPAMTILCTECGARFLREAESCPVCGFETDLMLGELDRRPRRHIMQPVSNVLPIVTAILIPGGMVLLIGIPIVDEIFRGAVEDLLIGLICIATGSMELAAIICGCTWLYQAWRAVLRGDEDYPPSLMVALLFVPFFNFYWMFRAIPGLSTAIQREWGSFGARRLHGAGYVPGIVGCVFMLIPYFQPVALCIFVAWMLIVNAALQRLIRYQEDHGLDADRG